MKIAIDIPLSSEGTAGGVEQFLIGLLNSLDSHSTTEEYSLIVNRSRPNWISDSKYDMEVLPRSSNGVTNQISRAYDILPSLNILTNRIKSFLYYNIIDHPRPSNNEFKAAGADVVHFPTQNYRLTDLPSIYNPHDLQHEHYPEFFSEKEVEVRRKTVRTGCQRADAIDVPSMFTKNSIVEEYNVDPEKIYVIPRGPPVTMYERPTETHIEQVKREYNLPEKFIFYPAQTWPHKNHIKLVNSINYLREHKNQKVNLVCTGKRNDHWPEIKSRVDDLNLNDQFQFLGYVSPTDLLAIYRLSIFVVIPSLYEGGGFPVLEAWNEGKAVVCSDAAALSEKADGAALTFNPNSTKEIAKEIEKLWVSELERIKFENRGEEKLQEYDWEKTAELYRVLYRFVAGSEVTEKEEDLLKAAQSGEVIPKNKTSSDSKEI